MLPSTGQWWNREFENEELHGHGGARAQIRCGPHMAKNTIIMAPLVD